MPLNIFVHVHNYFMLNIMNSKNSHFPSLIKEKSLL